MGEDTLYIFLEGPDDEKFFKSVLSPLLEQHYFVKFILYSQMKRSAINSLVKNLQRTKTNYILVADKDESPSIDHKRQKITEKFENVDQKRVFIVIKEIESWYLAGLSKTCCKKLRIAHNVSTETVDKEQFTRLMPKKYTSKVDFMTEVLKLFSIETAKFQNSSFECFSKIYL